MKQTKDEKIIAALLAHPTVRSASKACEISETQIYARLRDPPFKAKYDKARQEMLEEATAAAQSSVMAAIGTMVKVLQNPENAAQVRLNAADMIVRNCLKLTEQNEIVKRLERLEEMEEKLEKHQ